MTSFYLNYRFTDPSPNIAIYSSTEVRTSPYEWGQWGRHNSAHNNYYVFLNIVRGDHKIVESRAKGKRKLIPVCDT